MKLEQEQLTREQGTKTIWIVISQFCRDVKQVLTPSKRIHKFIQLRQMQSWTQFQALLRTPVPNYFYSHFG